MNPQNGDEKDASREGEQSQGRWVRERSMDDRQRRLGAVVDMTAGRPETLERCGITIVFGLWGMIVAV